MTIKAIVQRFSGKLKPITQPFNRTEAASADLVTSPLDASINLLEQQLVALADYYRQAPSLYLDTYLQALDESLELLKSNQCWELFTHYSNQRLALYQGLNNTQLNSYRHNYIEALIDHIAILTQTTQETALDPSPQQLSKADLELYDSFHLTALDCYLNNLDKTTHPQQALAISQQMLTISKRAMQYSNNNERQQEYLYCLDNHLRLLNQLDQHLTTEHPVSDYYQQAMSLYQHLYQQGNGYERPYAQLLVSYNQHLIKQQQLKQALVYNQLIINQCLQQLQNDPDNFTGYLYFTALEQLTYCLDNSHHPELAQQLFQQATVIFAQLIEQDPTASQQANYAFILSHYAKYLAQNNQRQLAISYSKQSVAIYIELLSQSPQYELASEKALIQYQLLTEQL